MALPTMTAATAALKLMTVRGSAPRAYANLPRTPNDDQKMAADAASPKPEFLPFDA